jgi:hypothetical protein
MNSAFYGTQYPFPEGTLEWEEAILEWEEINQLETKLQWRRGDIALALKPNSGERIEDTLKAFAKAVDIKFSTLQDYRWVAKQYERVARANLSWTHHRFVAARPDRLEWLGKAEAATPKKWSAATMLEQIAAADARRAAEEEERQLLRRLSEQGADLVEQVKAGTMTIPQAVAEGVRREKKRIQDEEDHRTQIRVNSKMLASAIEFGMVCLALPAGQEQVIRLFSNQESDINFEVNKQSIAGAATRFTELAERWPDDAK